MSMKIILPASGVWAYFIEHKNSLISDMHLIATNEEFGIEIYLTNQCGYPSIVVNADDSEIHSEVLMDEDDCKKSVTDAYELYLTEKIVTTTYGDEEDDELPLTEEELIEDREAELDGAILDLLTVAMSECRDIIKIDPNELCEDVKEHVLEYLYLKHGISIYRPMYLEYDDKSVEFEQYPYGNMELENEDNPIYQNSPIS